MADFNQLTTSPLNYYYWKPVSIDPRTLLTQAPQYETGKVKTMTVSNGDVLQLYDVTNPSSPVLLGTIG